MTATSMVHVCVDEHLKTQATETLAAMGLSLSDAVRVFLTRVVAEQQLPFGWRGRRPLVPAHVHAPTQGVHHLRFVGRADVHHRPLSLAFAHTHRVSVPNRQLPSPALARLAIRSG